jgi:hypothetical protein
MTKYYDTNLASSTFATVSTGTGSGATATPNRKIVLGFDQYEIVLAVTDDNRVLSVLEVRQKKDFRNVKQKIASTGYVDMERFATE